MSKYMIAGFRKGAKSGGVYNLNTHLYESEKDFRNRFAWVDTDGNNMRKGSQKLTLDNIVKEIHSKGALWCENDDFFYVFKNII